MAWTNQDLANIDAAIATGAQEVRYADRTVVYRSIKDLMTARDAIYLSMQSGTPPVRQYRAYTNKGWSSGDIGSGC